MVGWALSRRMVHCHVRAGFVLALPSLPSKSRARIHPGSAIIPLSWRFRQVSSVRGCNRTLFGRALRKACRMYYLAYLSVQ